MSNDDLLVSLDQGNFCIANPQLFSAIPKAELRFSISAAIITTA